MPTYDDLARAASAARDDYSEKRRLLRSLIAEGERRIRAAVEGMNESIKLRHAALSDARESYENARSDLADAIRDLVDSGGKPRREVAPGCDLIDLADSLDCGETMPGPAVLSVSKDHVAPHADCAGCEPEWFDCEDVDTALRVFGGDDRAVTYVEGDE